MKKHIAEDLPARKHPQAQMSAQSKTPNNSERPEKKSGKEDMGGDKTPEQRISQAASDIRYRARRENIPLRTAYSQYMQNSSMSEAEKTQVRNKLFGKSGGMQAENFDLQMKNLASDAVVNALYKVFVKNESEIVTIDELKSELEEASEISNDRKYKVRVTDKKNGVTYTRFATREKISQLRAKGLEVEMTEYGTPYEGEKEKGEQTASALGGGKAKKDYDGDGKIESGAKEYRGSVHNAIQRKKGGVADGKDTSNVRESFLGEVSATANLPQVDSAQLINPNGNGQQIDILSPKVKNKVVVNPSSTVLAHTEINGYGKFLSLIQEKKLTKAEKAKKEQIVKSLKPKYGKTSKTYAIATSVAKKVAEEKEEKKGEEYGCEDDSRAKYAEKEVIKNKLRSALGIKNPIVMTAGYNPEGDQLDENPLVGIGLRVGGAALGTYLAGKAMEAAADKAKKEIKSARKTSKIGGDRYKY